MPVSYIGFSLKPLGFFDRNPALDVAPPMLHGGNGARRSQRPRGGLPAGPLTVRCLDLVKLHLRIFTRTWSGLYDGRPVGVRRAVAISTRDPEGHFMATSEAITSTKQPALAAGTLGLWGQLFQAVTHMAPAAGIVFSTQYMASQGGASHALAYVLATVACTLSALVPQGLVKKVRSAGGYFVIHSVALGDAAGFTTSWLYFIYDPVIVAAGSLLWPTIFTNFLRTYVGIDLPWWPFAIVMAGTLFVVTYVGVKQAAVVSMILGTIETLVFALFGIILIAKAGGNQPLVSFSPSSSPTALGGLMFASVFAILSFIGFESGVPMAEESNNARRNVIIGLMVSTVGIGLFYIAMGYATVAGWSGVQADGSTYINFSNFSHEDAVNFGQEFSGAKDPYFTLAARAFGAVGPLLMLLMLTNSMFAVGVAATNASTRVVFSLGRAKILPGILGHISARTRTPDGPSPSSRWPGC